ncbi:MAG: UDP-N-acetylmuramoyl-tripeptide--D-alanyl-D-alanine ligase, partial [Clostridia bacterium]|nr:UDP-N-acetylmuramoyl-tripeptide--D-alanyl-D-alanine ligase [Clostridia bacterium]
MAVIFLDRCTLSAEKIAKDCGGELFLSGGALSTESFSKVAIDSRDDTSDALFVAIEGERTDGHKYMLQCYEKGCRVFLCKRIPEEMAGKDFAAVLTEDPVSSLGKIASEYRKTFDLKVVGVTGSVGKTTTKEMIAAVCSRKYRTYKTDGNYNSVIGLPLTLLGMPRD